MKDLTNLTATDIMTRPVTTIRPNETLSSAEQMLVNAHVNGLPVVEHGRLVGIITRSDFVRIPVLLEALDGYVSERMVWSGNGMRSGEVTSFRAHLDDLEVKDVMTTQVATCNPETPVAEIAGSMIRHHVHRLVVMKDTPVGMVESLDLVRLIAD